MSSKPVRHHIDLRAAELVAQPAANPDDLLSPGQVAAWLEVSPQFLEVARHKGYGPKYIRLSPRRIRYRRQHVLDWLNQRAYVRTSDYEEAQS